MDSRICFLFARVRRCLRTWGWASSHAESLSVSIPFSLCLAAFLVAIFDLLLKASEMLNDALEGREDVPLAHRGHAADAIRHGPATFDAKKEGRNLAQRL